MNNSVTTTKKKKNDLVSSFNFSVIQVTSFKEILFTPNLIFLLKTHAKFRNPTIIPSGRKVTQEVFEGYIPVHEGYIPVHEGYILVHEGYIPVHAGYFLVHAGYIPVHEGYIQEKIQ